MASPNMTAKPGYLASIYSSVLYDNCSDVYALLHSYKLHNIRKLRPW